MKKLTTILIILASFAASGQTWEQVKTWIDSNTDTTIKVVDSYWETVYRNENYLRPELGDSVVYFRSVDRSIITKHPELDFGENEIKNDTIFLRNLNPGAIRQVLFFNGAWEYQRKVVVKAKTVNSQSKEEVLIKYLQKSNEISLSDSLYMNGLIYIREL